MVTLIQHSFNQIESYNYPLYSVMCFFCFKHSCISWLEVPEQPIRNCTKCTAKYCYFIATHFGFSSVPSQIIKKAWTSVFILIMSLGIEIKHSLFRNWNLEEYCVEANIILVVSWKQTQTKQKKDFNVK